MTDGQKIARLEKRIEQLEKEKERDFKRLFDEQISRLHGQNGITCNWPIIAGTNLEQAIGRLQTGQKIISIWCIFNGGPTLVFFYIESVQ